MKNTKTKKQQGLSLQEVKKKRLEFGLNELVATKKSSWMNMLLSQFTDLLVVILIGAGVVSFALGEHVDAFVILGIVLLNGGIGFFQEFRTEKTLEALKKMVHPEIRVLREGKEQLIETKFLVPGDLVILGEGDKVPADGKILEAHSLKIEESALTGESLPVEKKFEHEVFMGTSVAKGSGLFVVEKTGMLTKFGEIAKLTTETQKTKSPLQIELARIGVFVSKITLVICIILFGVGVWRGDGFLESLLYSVSVAIAAVPEGLPTTITIALALGATVLARKKAIIKKLSSVETLGAVTTICSDKTGTLTKNEMTVREIYLADKSILTVTGVGYDPHVGRINFVGGRDKHEPNKVLEKKILEICLRCNEAKLDKVNDKYSIFGDPTEGALLTLVGKSEFSDKDFEGEQKDIFPFDSDRKMMSVLVKSRENLEVLVKGSPDQVLEKCTYWFDGVKKHKLTDKKLESIRAHYTQMAENALRVLGFAYRTVKSNEDVNTEEIAENELVFVGLVGMIDPPRAEVKEAVDECRDAGIRVVVITGDFGITAKAIAQELGIVRNNKVRVLTGVEVDEMSDKTLTYLLQERDQALIFARSLPAQKMRVVELLQAQGEIVAMTGDGVNDAPALKKANIGIAMGITGTEVSKEAATMILMNDSFASIVRAVEEGRRIYANLRKFVWFIFSCNIAELFVIFAAILFVLPLPLTAILILCVDLGTDILPAIALGVDNAEKGLMKQKPRNIEEKIMNKAFVIDFLITGAVIGGSVLLVFLMALYFDGWNFGDVVEGEFYHAITVAFTTLVFVQLVNAFSSRSFTKSVFQQSFFNNQFLLVSVLVSVLLVLCIAYIPFLNDVLKTTNLTVQDWGLVAIGSFLPLFFIEIKKYLQRTKNR